MASCGTSRRKEKERCGDKEKEREREHGKERERAAGHRPAGVRWRWMELLEAAGSARRWAAREAMAAGAASGREVQVASCGAAVSGSGAFSTDNTRCVVGARSRARVCGHGQMQALGEERPRSERRSGRGGGDTHMWKRQWSD